MTTKRKILVTAALPYANGPAHLGHLVEQIYTDIWARNLRMHGHDCHFICAGDTHGTPIMVQARKNNVDPSKFVAGNLKDQLEDFRAFGIDHDYYGSTDSPTNRKFANAFYEKLKEAGKLVKKDSEQYYCESKTCDMFLPDRFVKGTCPKCSTKDQYGDQCEECSATYETAELIDPFCTTCKAKPTIRQTSHYYFRLSDYSKFLEQWVPKATCSAVNAKLQEWIQDGLKDWCISRDKPYFGFELPDEPGKYFYVWLDAPVGYISATEEWATQNGKTSDDYWKKDDVEVYHVIGKDIIQFHALFWPAMLKETGYSLPDAIFTHGMLTYKGKKMSKSRGDFVTASAFRKHMDPEVLRFYLAGKMGPGIQDFAYSGEDLVAKVNSDLVGKITNVGSRGAQMLAKHFDSILAENLGEEFASKLDAAFTKAKKVPDFFEQREFARAMQEIREIAEDANKFFDEHAPWKLVKEDKEKTHEVLTCMLGYFKALAICLGPVMPVYAKKAQELLGYDQDFMWTDLNMSWPKKQITAYSHLATRVKEEQIEKIFEETRNQFGVQMEPTTTESTETKAAEPSYITIDDFCKIELKVAKVTKAEEIPEARKLLKLSVDLGGEDQRTIFAGIKSAYKPEEIEGKLIAVVANLKPRKMKFGVSEGMLLAAGEGGSDVFLMSPDSGAKPGDSIG